MAGGTIAHSEYVGEILVRRGIVPAERIAPLFDTVRERGQPLIDLITQAKITDERAIAEALADEAGLPFMPKIEVDAIPDAVAGRIPISSFMRAVYRC